MTTRFAAFCGPVMLATAFALGFGAGLASTPALAVGDGGGSSNETVTCPKGYVLDKRKNVCLKAASGVVPDDALTDYAYALAKADRYQETLDVLDLLNNPNTPKALNYRGYATRKLGRVDEGIGYYLQSVTLDPNYAQVREYLGEAYVTKGKVDLAKAQLQAIERLCGTTCEEYQDLKQAIEASGADI
jgi:tetratricopeptide (TPR) repeat protein